METITFLGTGGARVMLATQILATGGLWFNLDNTEILVDPGPGTLVQAVKRKLDPKKLDAILLSHKHLDHSSDINVMIEAMTDGGFKKRGLVFAPLDALENDPVILQYLRSYPRDIILLREGGKYEIGNVIVETPLQHRHEVETYGFILRTQKHLISYIADTRYFDEIVRHYTGELLIINVVRLNPDERFAHLSLPDAQSIIQSLKPKIAILTHFGMTMWRAHPWELANKLSQETGVRVIAARDGMRFDLAQLDEP
jgi:ribonuclease BN (tRNA processing enzyme)